jgi:hypothetical protein
MFGRKKPVQEIPSYVAPDRTKQPHELWPQLILWEKGDTLELPHAWYPAVPSPRLYIFHSVDRDGKMVAQVAKGDHKFMFIWDIYDLMTINRPVNHTLRDRQAFDKYSDSVPYMKELKALRESKS